MTHGIKKINTKIDMCENPPQKNIIYALGFGGGEPAQHSAQQGQTANQPAQLRATHGPANKKKTAKRAQHLKTVTRFRCNNS